MGLLVVAPFKLVYQNILNSSLAMATLGELTWSFLINQNMVNTDTNKLWYSCFFFNCSLYWNWVNSYCSNLLKNNRFWVQIGNFLLPLCKAYPKLINSYQCQALAFLGNASVNVCEILFLGCISNTINEITDEERQFFFLCQKWWKNTAQCLKGLNFYLKIIFIL